MNVLLVMPRTVTVSEEWYVFPTGIAYVSSALKASRCCNVFTLNLNHVDNVQEALCDILWQHQIDVVATGGLAFQYFSIQQLIKTVKEFDDHITVLVGGAYISGDPVVGMTAIPEIDVGMIGEGEITICELIVALSQKNTLANVAGIIFRDETGKLVTTAPRAPIQDLDGIAFPDYDGFEFEKTLCFSPVNFGIYGEPAAVLLTSRGCPFNCSFCFHPVGNGYRRRSVDSVFKELDWLVGRYQIKGLLILDELFGGDEAWLAEFCTRIKKYHMKWWVETRVEFASKKNLELMKESGCVQVLFGIENVNNSILESMNKHISKDKIERALENAFSVGISAPGVLLFGDPAETKETIENTIRWWEENNRYNLILTTVQVYPGSGLWRYAIENGILPDLASQVRFVQNGCPKLNLTGLSDEEFGALCKRIGTLNKSHNLGIVRPVVLRKKWQYGKLIADVNGYCSNCGAENVWPDVNLLSEGGGAECFICQTCGQAHSNTFFDSYQETAYQNLCALLDREQKIAIWGQGRHLVQIFDKYPDLKDKDFVYINNSPAKVGQLFYGHVTCAPQELVSYDPDVLVIAVGEAHRLAVTSIVTELTESSGLPLADRAVTLTELMKRHDD